MSCGCSLRVCSIGKPYLLGGGAIVKPYRPGDENVTWEQISCPDYDHHGPDGCRSCGQQPLRHTEKADG